MAIIIHNHGAAWNKELYEKVAKKAFGGTLTPGKLPPGLIVHAASPDPEGGWRVTDIWESEAAWQSFLKKTLIPAAQENGAPPFDSKLFPVHNFLK